MSMRSLPPPCRRLVTASWSYRTGSQSGIVHVSKPQREVPAHFLKLTQCRGTIPVNQLRDMFRPLRSLNIRMAKELGRAYWSMMQRQDKSLMAGMAKAFSELMGEDVALPGDVKQSMDC